MRTLTRGALGVLVLAGLLLAVADRWGSLNTQEGQARDVVQRPSKTFDDRQRHEIRLVVRYRPARQLGVVWGIGVEGDYDRRQPGDRPEFAVVRTNVPDGTPTNISASNFDRGGYLYCAIEQDDEIVREFREERTEHRDECNLTFVVGDRPER